jgi:hypothetical protein
MSSGNVETTVNTPGAELEREGTALSAKTRRKAIDVGKSSQLVNNVWSKARCPLSKRGSTG